MTTTTAPATTDGTDKQNGKQVRPFAEFLQQQRKGRTHRELSDQLNELVGAVLETGKAGEITLKLKVKPASKGDLHTVLVTDEIKAKIPTADRGESLFFADDHHNLSRSNPNQGRLPLGVVGDEDDDTTGGAAL